MCVPAESTRNTMLPLLMVNTSAVFPRVAGRLGQMRYRCVELRVPKESAIRCWVK